MKKLLQTIMAIPIAERIGRVFGRKSMLRTGAELVSARLIMRSFGAMLALGAVAGGIGWLKRKPEAAGGNAEGGETDADKPRAARRRSRKAEEASGA